MYWNKKNYSKGFWIWGGIKMFLGMILFTILVGGGFMLLWNGIMPAVFGLGVISFWQSLGLILIGRLLFGGFWKRKSHWHRRNRYQVYYQYCQKMKEQQVTVE